MPLQMTFFMAGRQTWSVLSQAGTGLRFLGFLDIAHDDTAIGSAALDAVQDRCPHLSPIFRARGEMRSTEAVCVNGGGGTGKRV